MSPTGLALVFSLALAQATPDSTAEWQKIDQDGQAMETNIQQGDKATVAKLVPSLKKRLDHFAAKYPHDPNAPQARLFSLQMSILMRELAMPGAPTMKEIVDWYGKIVADDSAPADVRAEAAVRQTALFFQVAVESKMPGDWDAAEARVDAIAKAHEEMAGRLRQEEIGAEKMAADPARFDALLTKLAQDPNPEVTTMVDSARTAQKQLVELRSKPLDIKFTAVDGRTVDLAALRGKVVLVDFWATWCVPCLEETPELVAAYKKYHDKGFEIVGISLDEDKNALLKWTAQNEMTWPQYFDGLRWDNSISSRFGIQSVPAMWLVGKDGILITEDAREDLDGQLSKLLGPK